MMEGTTALVTRDALRRVSANGIVRVKSNLAPPTRLGSAVAFHHEPRWPRGARRKPWLNKLVNLPDIHHRYH